MKEVGVALVAPLEPAHQANAAVPNALKPSAEKPRRERRAWVEVGIGDDAPGTKLCDIGTPEQ